MSLNSIELSLFTKEFKELLPLRIEKLYIPEENIVILTLYKQNFKKMLLIEVGSNYSGLYFIKERPKQRLKASIQNKFRNLLTSAIITNILQVNEDRVLELTVKLRDKYKKVILELTGRHGNIFIVEENIEAMLLNKKDIKRDLTLYGKYSHPITSGALNKKSMSSDFLNDSDFNNRSFLEWLEIIYAKKIIEIKEENLKSSFISKIDKKIKKLKRKRKRLVKDLEKLKSYENNKRVGELLKANLYLLKRGAKSISVIDYYDPNMKKVEIILDKTKTPIQNMEYYFKKYDKFKRGVKFIKIESEKVEKEILLLEKKRENDIINEEIELLRDKNSKNNRKIVDKKHSPYKIYQSSNKKYRILVGKGSIDNDYLTFKVASGNDIWLHVISYSGSHVVIKRENKKDKIDINTIMEGAHLAILNSKAPNDDNVEVCYTFRKFVKKPPKSKPGAVIYSQEKRVYLKLDRKVIEKLIIN